MNPEKFTSSSQELINHAINLAHENKNPTLLPIHTLAAGLANDFCQSVFKVLNVNIVQLGTRVEEELAKLPKVEDGQLTTDYSLEQFLLGCEKEAEKLGDTYISLEHFILQWTESQYMPASILSFL